MSSPRASEFCSSVVRVQPDALDIIEKSDDDTRFAAMLADWPEVATEVDEVGQAQKLNAVLTFLLSRTAGRPRTMPPTSPAHA
jgi:hypothetical protein